MSKELIGKIRDELSDGGVIVSPYWAELFKESAEALETQAREIERLNSDYNEACEDAMCVARELERQKMNCLNLLQQLEDLKAQPGRVVLPDSEHMQDMIDRLCDSASKEDAVFGWHECLEFVARLNSSPVSSAPSHGEQVRHMVLAGWKLVPVEPTPEMISAAEEAHMPFGDMDIALRCALFAAPSAGSQKEQGE